MATHRWGLITIGLLLAASTASARTITDEQAWINLTAISSLSGRLLYLAEVQPRFGAGDDRFRQLNLRGALGWKASDAISIFAGYARVETDRAGARGTSEDRPFQLMFWSLGRTPLGELSSRTRLEQRWRDDGDRVGWRFRQMLRTTIPIETRNRPVKALISVEGFAALNSTDWGVREGFDQLRSFAGVEVPLKGRSTVEAGYLNQLVNAPGGDVRINHVLSLALFLRL